MKTLFMSYIPPQTARKEFILRNERVNRAGFRSARRLRVCATHSSEQLLFFGADFRRKCVKDSNTII